MSLISGYLIFSVDVDTLRGAYFAQRITAGNLISLPWKDIYRYTKMGNNMEAVIIHSARQIMLMVPLADKHVEIPSGVMYDDGVWVAQGWSGKNLVMVTPTGTLFLSFILLE